MKTIRTTEALAEFCQSAAAHPYVTVDTEFLRERTYYAQLCLVQIAYRTGGAEDAVLVDALEEGLSLEPLYELMRNPNVTKVFHAARQDIEIFYVDGGVIPAPLFDTQVAAMVCGFGEQVGYETLVRKICKSGLDKSSRFTDWSRRPLSEKQMRYALADVTFLRDIYEELASELGASGRDHWVAEEMAVLTDTETYTVEPEHAWKRVKTRSTSPRFIAVVQKLAALRERLAQSRNVPRNRIFKDDVILELAATRPVTLEDLGRARLLQREARKGPVAEQIVAAIGEADGFGQGRPAERARAQAAQAGARGAVGPDARPAQGPGRRGGRGTEADRDRCRPGGHGGRRRRDAPGLQGLAARGFRRRCAAAEGRAHRAVGQWRQRADRGALEGEEVGDDFRPGHRDRNK